MVGLGPGLGPVNGSPGPLRGHTSWLRSFWEGCRNEPVLFPHNGKRTRSWWRQRAFFLYTCGLCCYVLYVYYMYMSVICCYILYVCEMLCVCYVSSSRGLLYLYMSVLCCYMLYVSYMLYVCYTSSLGGVVRIRLYILGVGMSTLGTQTVCTPRIGGSKYRWPWSMYLLGRLYNLGAWPTISFQVAIKHTNLSESMWSQPILIELLVVLLLLQTHMHFPYCNLSPFSLRTCLKDSWVYFDFTTQNVEEIWQNVSEAVTIKGVLVCKMRVNYIF